MRYLHSAKPPIVHAGACACVCVRVSVRACVRACACACESFEEEV